MAMKEMPEVKILRHPFPVIMVKEGSPHVLSLHYENEDRALIHDIGYCFNGKPLIFLYLPEQYLGETSLLQVFALVPVCQAKDATIYPMGSRFDLEEMNNVCIFRSEGGIRSGFALIRPKS